MCNLVFYFVVKDHVTSPPATCNMSITLGTHALFKYNEKHNVLICRECKYAIQKGAVGSHLLRHKIYRGERQQLLSSIARLELAEPDDVQLPSPSSPPVDALPVLPGYKCMVSDCEYLCASSKRMRRHWSENHGMSDPPDSLASPVNLQTFFRGTKIKYFEVASSSTTDEGPLVNANERLTQRQDVTHVATPVACPQPSASPPSPLSNLDLEMLRYFHHFTNSTSVTLPVGTHGTLKHWQTDVVAQALRSRWLMCGLLAISASHLAALSNDEITRRAHQQQSTLFLEQFTTGWEDLKHRSGTAEVEEVEVGAQMICIQRCYQWTTESSELDQEMISMSTPFQLPSFMATVQGCAYPTLALRPAMSSDYMPGETFIRMRGKSRESPATEISSDIPPTLLERIRGLPARLAEVLDKPDSPADFFATLSAIDALVECCSLSYASDDVGAVWDGMESWLGRLPEHFNRMVWRRSSAALIVLAHWALLVERTGHFHWFLKGSAKRLLHQTVRELPEDSNLQSLVENLLG